MSSQQWYVKVDSRTVGPLSTDLVLRGLADGELPSNALVCRAGAYSWLPLSAVPTFSTGTARPATDAGSAGGSAAHGSGRLPASDAYEAVKKPGGLGVAAARASRAEPPSARAGESEALRGGLADSGEVRAEGDSFDVSPPDGSSRPAVDSAHEGAGSAGNGAPAQADAPAQEPRSARIRPAFTLSVSPSGADTTQGAAEVSEPSALPDIDEDDFGAPPGGSSPTADRPAAPAGPVATLRSVVLDSGGSGQTQDRDSSIVVTAQVVLSDRVTPTELHSVRATDARESSGVATVREAASLIDRIEAGAWRLEQVPGSAVPTGQTVVIHPTQATTDPAQTQRLQAQEPPATLRENPFMSKRPVDPEPSPSTRANGALRSGPQGSLPESPALESSAGSEIERAAEAFDWSQQFCGYFQMGESFELPDQRVLLRSLQLASLDVLVQPEAMWNLAVCLALGSDALAMAAAHVFFRIMMAYPSRDRLDWMARVLLSRGFLPSGIPLPAGERAVRLLQASCPPELRSPLSEALAE
jgi:hypothetical protein